MLPRGGQNGSGQRVSRSTRNMYFEVNSPPGGVQSSLVVASWHGHHGDTGRGTQEDSPASQYKVGPSCGLTGTRIHWVVTKHHHFQQRGRGTCFAFCGGISRTDTSGSWKGCGERGARGVAGHFARQWPHGEEKAGAGVRTVLGPHLP